MKYLSKIKLLLLIPSIWAGAAGLLFASPVVVGNEAHCFVDAGFSADTVGWGTTHFQTLENAWIAVADGGRIDVAAGSYEIGTMVVGKSADIAGSLTGETVFLALGEVTSDGWWQIDAATELGLESCILSVSSNGVDAVAFNAEGALDMKNCSILLSAGCKAIETSGHLTAVRNYWGAETPFFASILNPARVEVEPWFKDPARTTLSFVGDVADISDTFVVSDGLIMDVDEVSLASGAKLDIRGGTLRVAELSMDPSSEIMVVDGSIVLGTAAGETEVAGTFTIYDAMGSLYIENDTEFSGDTLALISHIEIASGAKVTVSGSLILDGCTVECSDEVGSYLWDVDTGASFKMARTEMSGFSSLLIKNTGTDIQSCRLGDGFIQILAIANDAKVFHNVLFNGAQIFDAGVDTVLEVDGWFNVESEDDVQNLLVLEWNTNNLPSGRTLTADALYVQPGDVVDLSVNLSKLSMPVSGCELLLGYNGTYLTNGNIELETPWEQDIYQGWSLKDNDPLFGQVDSGIGLGFSIPDLRTGLTNSGPVASISFDSTENEGETVMYFRPQIDELWHTRLASDTNGMSGTYLEPFTVNSLPVVIDGTDPEVDAFWTFQDQDPVTVDVFDPENITLRGTVLVNLEVSDFLSGVSSSSISVTHRDTSAPLETTLISTTKRTGGVDYSWALVVPEGVEPGVYDVEVRVADRSGNEVIRAATIEIVVPSISSSMDLQYGPSGSVDFDITFHVFDAFTNVLHSWQESVEFIDGTASGFVLEDLPQDSAFIRVKSAKSLSRFRAIIFDSRMTASVDLTGTSMLLTGDLRGDDLINNLDYLLLRNNWLSPNPEGDANGDGVVNNLDFIALRENWFTAGELVDF